MFAGRVFPRCHRSHLRRYLCAWAASALVLVFVAPADATKLLLNDGRVLEGRFAAIAGVADDPTNPQSDAGEVKVTPILVIDDGLRRTFVHKSQVSQVIEQASEKLAQIKVWQDTVQQGEVLTSIGRPIRLDPFDEYGRRIFELRTANGTLPIVQGITLITPNYSRVLALAGTRRPIIWDMRLATSSIPPETLDEILKAAVPQNDLEARLQVVRLYLQSERYRDARLELERVVQEFPGERDFSQDLRQLRQLGARSILNEINLRQQAGQHQLVRSLLANFPSDEVAGETLQEVRELLDEYAAKDAEREQLIKLLKDRVAQITNEPERKAANEFVDHIAKIMGPDTQVRLASFLNLADDASLSAERQAAMAISGWLVGTRYATDNIHVALSMVRVNELVREYLAELDPLRREALLAEMREMEGASIERVAQLLKLMTPPVEVSEEDQIGPGLFEITVPGLEEQADVTYLVQLPPEYDPLRHYPTIVTLAGEGYQPEHALNFWCGLPDDKNRRRGQAGRHGYITLAIAWQKPYQASYGFSAREHQSVLSCLRDARRRFAIDTDRVFLTGHGIGGDAAWDIALAHPDEWAGVIPFTARADRFIPRYWENAEYVPAYFVGGELDSNKVEQNAREYDRYLRPKFNATIVEYLGRGFEPFGDEIQRIFDWMGRQRRTMPTEFECATMRPWDNFFWWLELRDLPERSMAVPEEWPPPRGARPMKIKSSRTGKNRISVSAQADQVIVWLSPEFIDFSERITMELFGRRITPRDRTVEPDLEILLEDARTRADRQHPFWAKVESGRGKAEGR